LKDHDPDFIYENCIKCGNNDTYGNIQSIELTDDIDDEINDRICKACMMIEIQNIINPPFNVKPAKQ
jgi:hypothetical protein